MKNKINQRRTKSNRNVIAKRYFIKAIGESFHVIEQDVNRDNGGLLSETFHVQDLTEAQAVAALEAIAFKAAKDRMSVTRHGEFLEIQPR